MENFSRSAVESFVQTVVFVDDKIYAPHPSGTVIEEKKLIGPKTRKPSIKSAVHASASTMPLQIPEELASFSPHDIQASYAKKRIVCSLHQPMRKNQVGIESDTYKLCASADIVIVDWDLYGDDGVKAKALIENLVIQSLNEDPHQLRLVLIYTDSPNLFDISSKVYESLASKISDKDKIEYKKKDDGLAFHTLNARVVVLGKPAKRLDVYKPFEVTEAELADRTISEFCKLADGMLQGGILMGLAAIRKQSRKILTKFHSGLDAAFLTHRALGLPYEEAFDHITPLLVSEIEAVLNDSLPTPLIGNAIIGNWCKEKWTPTLHSSQFVSKDINTKDFAENFCTMGMDICKKYISGKNSELEKTIKSLKNKSPNWPSVDAPTFKLLTSYLSKNDSGDDLRELSILMSQRTNYGDDRHLTLGTIMRENFDDERYLICLQPTCDSIRLKNQSTFIFCLLQMARGEKATHVVRDHAKGFIDLIFKPKSENCVTLLFKPNSKGFVTASKLDFVDHSDSRSYRWIAQMKPKHAQRAAEQFARELSRVGLTESEWLRLKSK